MVSLTSMSTALFSFLNMSVMAALKSLSPQNLGPLANQSQIKKKKI